MIAIYCAGNCKTKYYLCPECNELRLYSEKKLDQCPFKEKKKSCKKCHVHCYAEKYKNKIKKVMRYAGPRMIYKHPVLTLFHLLIK